MPRVVERRVVTPAISHLRDFLRGRGHTNAHRFADGLAARTQPPPDIPGGPYHKTSKIYYFSRDARREVEPPLIIVGAGQLEAGSQPSSKQKLITPGKTWQWD